MRDLNLDHSHRGAQPRLSSTGQAASIASALHLLSALFLFNQFGDLERCMLRPGNVHSGERWRDEAEAIPARRLHRDQPGASRQVVKFYNGRGTAEQHIKEGKNAIRWTR
ncbi:MAG: transposase, partial [Geminicoccaceae bacterium]|nr:transposase [Geminicoccaceae bacterium]